MVGNTTGVQNLYDGLVQARTQRYRFQCRSWSHWFHGSQWLLKPKQNRFSNGLADAKKRGTFAYDGWRLA